MTATAAARWTDPVWLSAAHTWIGQRLDALGLTPTGAIEQPHVYPWSTVLRVPTDAGHVWFKAIEDALRHEVVVVSRIAARRPDVVPPLLAADEGTGWMLMSDAGETLRSVIARERDLARWLDVLPRYADVQLDLVDDADELVARGVPDRRLAALPAAYAALVDDIGAEPRFHAATATVARLCETLAAFGLPETVQHDDLHDGQVYVRDGQCLVMDWGDACITHPFLTLAVTLDGTIAWGLDDVQNSVDTDPYRDAYLRPFVERFGGGDLVGAATVARRLGWACRAVNGHVPGDDAATLTRLRMFLDGHP